MKQAIPIISIAPDKRRVKEDGSYPLKLRISYKGERKYYSTGFSSTLEEWNTIENKNVRGALKKIHFAINDIKMRAEKCIDSLDIFSFNKINIPLFAMILQFYPNYKHLFTLASKK